MASQFSGAIVTFRLTLHGTVPPDATFGVQDGFAVGGPPVSPQHAIYLCSNYIDGYPLCRDGENYDDALPYPQGAQLSYRFWRELDPSGTEEAIQEGELTVGTTDQIVAVTYDFP